MWTTFDEPQKSIGIVFGKASRWWGIVLLEGEKKKRDVKLDVVAESTDGETVLIGECRWSDGENGRLLTRQLENSLCRDKTGCRNHFASDHDHMFKGGRRSGSRLGRD